MKMVFNALSTQLGGGQAYLINLFKFVPVIEELELVLFAPASLKLLDHPRVRRVEPVWPTENPIVRTLREKWVLPGILKAEQANVMPMRELMEDSALCFSSCYSKNIGGVLVDALPTPELSRKLSSAAVLQSGKFDFGNTSKKKTWSELLAWPNVQKKVLAR